MNHQQQMHLDTMMNNAEFSGEEEDSQFMVEPSASSHHHQHTQQQQHLSGGNNKDLYDEANLFKDIHVPAHLSPSNSVHEPITERKKLVQKPNIFLKQLKAYTTFADTAGWPCILGRTSYSLIIGRLCQHFDTPDPQDDEMGVPYEHLRITRRDVPLFLENLFKAIEMSKEDRDESVAFTLTTRNNGFENVVRVLSNKQIILGFRQQIQETNWFPTLTDEEKRERLEMTENGMGLQFIWRLYTLNITRADVQRLFCNNLVNYVYPVMSPLLEVEKPYRAAMMKCVNEFIPAFNGNADAMNSVLSQWEGNPKSSESIERTAFLGASKAQIEDYKGFVAFFVQNIEYFRLFVNLRRLTAREATPSTTTTRNVIAKRSAPSTGSSATGGHVKNAPKRTKKNN